MEKFVKWLIIISISYIFYNCASLTFSGNSISDYEELVFIPGGTFIMGDTWDIGDTNQLPTHEVTLQDFSIGIYEVTNKQFAEVFNWALEQEQITVSNFTIYNSDDSINVLYQIDNDNDNSDIGFFEELLTLDSTRNDFPCIGVSWYGAVAYCNYLSEKDGLAPCYSLDDWTLISEINGYRLPTEAEWEYAARGGKKSSDYKFSGSNIIEDVGWYKFNSLGMTHKVGGKIANELGLFDMTGNVFEWCWDIYRSYSSIEQVDTAGVDYKKFHVIRGGNCFCDTSNCYNSYRSINNPPPSPPNSINLDYVGFRVVLQE